MNATWQLAKHHVVSDGNLILWNKPSKQIFKLDWPAHFGVYTSALMSAHRLQQLKGHILPEHKCAFPWSIDHGNGRPYESPVNTCAQHRHGDTWHKCGPQPSSTRPFIWSLEFDYNWSHKWWWPLPRTYHKRNVHIWGLQITIWDSTVLGESGRDLLLPLCWDCLHNKRPWTEVPCPIGHESFLIQYLQRKLEIQKDIGSKLQESYWQLLGSS